MIMSTITINKEELKKLIRETMEDVFNEKKELIGDAVVEALEDAALGRAIEVGRTGEYIDTNEFKRKLASKIARLK
jgi:predicted metal-dependent RNase